MSDELRTGGGANVGGDARSGRDFIGRDSITYADTQTWRNFITRDIDAIRTHTAATHLELRAEIAELKGRVMFLLVVVFLIFILGAVSTAFTIRQFDQMTDKANYDSRRIDLLERNRIYPYP